MQVYDILIYNFFVNVYSFMATINELKINEYVWEETVLVSCNVYYY